MGELHRNPVLFPFGSDGRVRSAKSERTSCPAACANADHQPSATRLRRTVPPARVSKATREGESLLIRAVDTRSLICLYSYSAHEPVRTPCTAPEEPSRCKSHAPKRPEGFITND